MYYADFLNRMGTFKNIPASTVQKIVSKYLTNTEQSLKRKEKVFRESLMNIQVMCQADIEKVVQDVIYNDPFLEAQTSLRTDYKRKKFMKENMKYISRSEIVLNKQAVKNGMKKDNHHYIPIIESFKALIEDPSMTRMINMNITIGSEEKF